MADKGGDRELPQRFRGDARTATSPSGSRVAPVVPTGGEVTTPSVQSGNGPGGTSVPDPRGGGRAGSADAPQERVRAANAGPLTEDEVTEWIGTAGKSPEAAPGVAPDAKPESASWLGAGLAALIVIPALVIGSLTVVAVRHFTGTQAPGATAVGHEAAIHHEAAIRHEAAVRGQAAAWVAQQVGRGVAVSCDQVTCAALETRGLPARDLLVLGPHSRDPRSSAVVVETGTVRALFGTSLDRAWAPAVLASFGSGSAGITVRVVASHGAVAYQTALAGDMAAAKAAGARLLADRRITVQTSARSQLTGGLVDLRLLSALTALSRHLPISIVQFGNPGPGPSGDVPLRFVDLSESDRAGHLSSAAYVRTLRAYLNAVDVRFRPARMITVLADGQAVLRVEVTAPSPLGVFVPQSSP
ncbi:MAG TPA: hypothetical protein VFW50_15425 [Streptosporangiaceae bacterium]|nr:hypothetical protein [Streptosporangiaceae bacterium]